MQIIDVNTVVVDNFADLSSVLSTDNTYTYVYLDADIDMTSGIQIYNGKTSLVIDGEYPQGSGTVHRLKDSGPEFGMIYKNNVSPLNLTFKNMTIYGLNYYGMPRIADGNTDVSVTYQNVEYTGPQIIWHWSGLTRFIDCDITITSTGGSAVEEIAQACQVEIGGKTIIRHTPTATFASFYFYKTNASLTILENADVEITTNNNFLYNEYPPKFVIQKNATFNLVTQNGFSRSATHRLSSFLVDEGATFNFTQNTNSIGLGSMYIEGPFTVNSGARVYMQADFTTSTTTRRILQFTANTPSTRGLYLNNPKSFILYTRGPGTALYSVGAGTTPFSFKAGQVNFWRDAGLFPAAGTFDDPPLYPWHNPDWSNFEITGGAGTSSTTINSTTLTPPISPALSNLKLYEARVLSVGILPLTVNTIVDNLSPITGKTDPYANIKIEYTIGGIVTTLTGTADETGAFSITPPSPIPAKTEVSVSANVPFLYIKVLKVVEEAGELYIQSAPTLIQFIAPPVSSSPLCILGRSDNVPVVVIDTRAVSTKWELTATIEAPMYCPDFGGLTLPGKVVFVPAENDYDNEAPIEPSIYTHVYTGGPYITPTKIEWTNHMGILLHVTGAIRLGAKYKANLIWQVTPIAEP